MEKTDPFKQQEAEILPLDRRTDGRTARQPDRQSETAFRNMLQFK